MNPQSSYGIQSTAGAVPVRNEKGKNYNQSHNLYS
jgi:hypothetical protein